MKLKDKIGNIIEIYQARNGSVQLLFGHNSVELYKWQIEGIGLDSNLRDIEDFNEEDYKSYYNELVPIL